MAVSIPTVSVVIVSYNTAKLTLQAIDSVLASVGVRLQIWVVDNASSDRTLLQCQKRYGLRRDADFLVAWQKSTQRLDIKHKFPSIKRDAAVVGQIWRGFKSGHEVILVASTQNLGFGRGNNLAAANATGDFLFFLNSDAVVEPKTIRTLTRQFRPRRAKSNAVLAGLPQHFANPGIVAAQLLNPDGSIQLQGGALPNWLNVVQWITFWDDVPLLGQILPPYQHHMTQMRQINRREITKVGWVGGTAMMVARACWEEIGGFDPEIFMYSEDVELCWRAKQRHWDVAIATRAKVTHLGSASSDHRQAILGELRGLIYIWQKHHSPLATWWLRRLLRFGIRLRILVFGILRRYGQQRIYQEALALV